MENDPNKLVNKSAKMSSPSGFSQAHQFEPLLPLDPGGVLGARSAEITARATALTGKAHPRTRARLRELLRSMNSYYSNRIEGQGTHPFNIERALKHDYSKRPDTARLQRIALAHIEAERDLERAAAQGHDPLGAEFAVQAHLQMYRRLSDADRTTPDGMIVVPGALRTRQVQVGLHLAPVPEALPVFLARYEAVYGAPGPRDQRLLVAAAAHHRLAWVHPFLDGNGRATRLVTHSALAGLSEGLWSIGRGLARRRDEYYERLRDADSPRRGDLDGRGNLSEDGLRRWCEFFLEVCDDQVSFMARMLDLDAMKDRLLALTTFRAATDGRIRGEVALPLHHLFAAGPVTRGEFKQLTGLGDRTAQTQLSQLLEVGLLESESPRGPVSFGMPLDALQFMFPELYPEASTRAED